jgi:hypothetical protein
MYSMSNIRAQLSEQLPTVQTTEVPKPSGLLMRRARELREETPVPYNAAESILNHIKKYQETATLEEGIDTQTVEEAPRPRAKGDAAFNVPVRGLMKETFQSELGFNEQTAEVLTKAFLLNFRDESGLIPDRVETVPNVHGTRGKGFYQLTGNRRDAFEAVYGKDGYTEKNQVEFLVKELLSTEKSAGEAIFQAAQSGNVGETAAVIVDKFLRPAEEYKQERMKNYRSRYGS